MRPLSEATRSGEACARPPRGDTSENMKLKPVMAVALVALLSSCASPPSSLSVAQLEGTRSARQLKSAESYQKRMNDIRSAHRFWGPQAYETRREEIDSASALLLNSVDSD